MTSRLLHLLGVVAFAVAVSGGGRALHYALEHAPGAGEVPHSCAGDEATHEAPSEPREPAPDDECPVCVTIQSSERVGVTPDAVDLPDDETFLGVVHPRRVAPARLWAWSAGPARAPPVCA